MTACSYAIMFLRPTIDEAVRDARTDQRNSAPVTLYVHPGRVPLTEAVIIPEDFGVVQASVFDIDEALCDSGHCFV